MKLTLKQAKQIAGTWTASILLYYIHTELKKTKTIRDGYKWIAWSRDEWMEYLCMTRSEYDSALSRLKKLGVITSEIHLWGDKTRAFIRLSDMFMDVETQAKKSKKKPAT